MKIFKIILVVILIVLIAFGGWRGYGLYKNWEAKRFSEIEFLKRNQDLMIQKITELSITTTKVVNETAKVSTIPKVDANYESLKEQVIELKKNESVNKDEIKVLKEKLSEQRQAFLASNDTLLIKTTNDETLLLYRDTEGTLQPASDNISKIIEHKNISEVPVTIEEAKVKKNNWNLKAGGYYGISEKGYGLIVSKGLINIKDYSLNVSILSDLKSLEGIKLGCDIGYRIKGNLELGAGITIDKTYYLKLEYTF
jgi:hypothetical protein